MSAAVLHVIALADLRPHPDNPRLQMREDVVERLAAEIALGDYGSEHALLVRPVDGGYQIVSGHHRAEAAGRAGLAEVPCWVKDLGDDEAFMQLVLSNTQGELSPLERGVHALGASGRWDSGELSLASYAERVGVTGAYIGQIRNAARVLIKIQETKLEFSISDLSDKAKHLYEISKAPSETWLFLVERLLTKGWSVADTASVVEKIRRFEIPAEHADWLPLADVVETYLRSDRLTPAAVAKLISAADGVLTYIDRDGTDQDREAFRAWLKENAAGDAWNARRISDYHAALIREIADRREAEAEAELPEGVDLRHGDFREIFAEGGPNGDGIAAFPAGCVDAIITDPPYPAKFLDLFGRTPPRIDPDTAVKHYDDFEEEGLAEVAARILKPGGICAVMVGQSYLPDIIARMSDSLDYHWTIAYLTPGGQSVQLWDRKVNTFWKPILIFTKGEYAGDWLGDVTRSDVNDNDKRHHHWGQSESGMADLIERLTKPGQLICDPFLGGGTAALVAHGLGRRFIGCDVDEACVTTTAARFAPGEEDGA